MRKGLIAWVIIASAAITATATAATWWVPGHYQGGVYISGHTRGTAGWLSPHWNYTPYGAYFIPGHYTNPLPRLYPSYPTWWGRYPGYYYR